MKKFRYVHHLEHWLEYFPPSQIYLVDGDGLRKNPASALKDLVASLHQPEFSFEEFLYFDEKKGFFCLSINGMFIIEFLSLIFLIYEMEDQTSFFFPFI